MYIVHACYIVVGPLSEYFFLIRVPKLRMYKCWLPIYVLTYYTDISNFCIIFVLRSRWNHDRPKLVKFYSNFPQPNKLNYLSLFLFARNSQSRESLWCHEMRISILCSDGTCRAGINVIKISLINRFSCSLKVYCSLKTYIAGTLEE